MFLVYIYLINLYIRPQDWITFFYGWPVDFLVIIPALIIGYFQTVSQKKRFAEVPQYYLLIVLLIAIAFSNLIQGNTDIVIAEVNLFFKKMCIFVMIILLVNSTEKLKRTLWFMAFLSAIISGQAILQFFSGGSGLAGQDFYHSGTGVRTMWVGLWNGANAMSLLLNISIPFALEFSFGAYSLIYRLLSSVILGCLMFGIYTSNSRGGFVTLLVVLLLYPIIRFRNKKLALITGFLLAALMLIYFAPSRISQLNSQESSAHERTRLWNNAIDLFKDTKSLGVGKGRFAAVTPRHMLAHSNFMQNLAEIGLVGTFFWVALIYFCFKGMASIYRLTRLSPTIGLQKIAPLNNALLLSLIGFNVSTLFVTNEIDIFYLLLGLCTAVVNIYNREVSLVKIDFRMRDAKNILLIIFLMIGFYYVQTIK